MVGESAFNAHEVPGRVGATFSSLSGVGKAQVNDFHESIQKSSQHTARNKS